MTAWTPQDLGGLTASTVDQTRIIEPAKIEPMVPGLDVWDIGVVRTLDGATADFGGRALWVALAAPARANPVERHDVASLRLFQRSEASGWTDLGPLLDPARAFGSRQWAGSAVLIDDELWITYTAAGDAAEAKPTFKQRMFEVTATIASTDGQLTLTEQTEHRELVLPDPALYDLADAATGEPGFIKAFRDPFPFRDPSTGDDHVLFAGSLPPGKSSTGFNGVVGIARRAALSRDGWQLLDPLITADGVNNELERPHIVVVDGNFYLFFSTQARTFHPDVDGPTGLYAFVAPTLFGPYRPVNGHGAVLANPLEEPLQAYSWLVLDDLTVVSFVDAHSLRHSTYDVGSDEIASDRSHFGGTIAPAVRVWVDGDRAGIADHDADLPR